MYIYLLTSEHNQYDIPQHYFINQCGEYFLAAFKESPAPEQIKQIIIDEYGEELSDEKLNDIVMRKRKAFKFGGEIRYNLKRISLK
jgi:hypothetical protein